MQLVQPYKQLPQISLLVAFPLVPNFSKLKVIADTIRAIAVELGCQVTNLNWSFSRDVFQVRCMNHDDFRPNAEINTNLFDILNVMVYPIVNKNSLAVTTALLIGSWSRREQPARLFLLPHPLWSALKISFFIPFKIQEFYFSDLVNEILRWVVDRQKCSGRSRHKAQELGQAHF